MSAACKTTPSRASLSICRIGRTVSSLLVGISISSRVARQGAALADTQGALTLIAMVRLHLG